PEPIRSALVEGASWWAQAFDAAGFIDAFQVRRLPVGASPLDVRYNVIQWVHRATRGWSYGGGVIDPRTGEMIQGRVTLGSLRIRQDRMIFEGLAGTERTGTGAAERAGLHAILAENRAKGYLYLSDADTRPAGAAHPLAAMWDNGDDPIAGLAHERAVRRIALRRFGERNLPPGSPRSTLDQVLVPLYFHHRYALDACAKSIGGLDYAYSVRGDGTPPATPVPAARQRAALEAVLATLDPAE